MRTINFQDARRRRSSASPGRLFLFLTFFLVIRSASAEQLDFRTAIRLAVRNSPRVRAAQLDAKKAQASLAVAKDIFIPSVVTGGGLGWTYGITLTVPTIFTVGAQSLVYSNQQRFTIRAAHADIEAAQYALTEARQEVEEDAAITCIGLDENRAALATLAQQREYAEKLVKILEDRVRAGIDSDLDLNKARRGGLQIELQQMQAEDDRASLLSHLAELTGEPGSQLEFAGDTIPAIPDVHAQTDPALANAFTSPGILAAEATQRAKLERARGDEGYTWKPIISFGAQYGRVSPINNVSSFYNLHGDYNTANIGVQLSFPLLDRVRKAAARLSMADAARSAIDVSNQRSQEVSGRLKLQRSVRMMETKAEMAELDLAIAQDELKSATIQMHAPGGSPPLTPKEEENAKLEERQKYLDLLDARLQLSKAKISLLRQTGQLDSWLQSQFRATPVQ